MRLTIFVALLMCLQPLVAAPQDSSLVPKVPLTSKTLQVQNQAEQAYEQTDYEKAFFIYRNELAPIGDKYGQYMVGLMYLTGQGVDEDRVAASAWYRLAAERGIKEFVQISDQHMNSLDAEQTAQSDHQFIQLRKEYGDLALLMKAVKADYEILKTRTGTRLSGDSTMVTIVDPNNPAAMVSGADYFGKIEKRMEARLEFIAANTNIEIVDLDNMNMTAIESRVDERLDELD